MIILTQVPFNKPLTSINKYPSKPVRISFDVELVETIADLGDPDLPLAKTQIRGKDGSTMYVIEDAQEVTDMVEKERDRIIQLGHSTNLRDQFAMAVIGNISGSQDFHSIIYQGNIEAACRDAYVFADAMLKAREAK